jgi:YegS/Rv2252/BmrU family lipid kinase
VRQALHHEKFELISALGFRDPAKLDAAVEQAVKDKVPLIVVGSGDGTIGMVAKHFIGSESVLGVLPLGTGNSFARDLGIAPNVQAAVRVLTQGKVVRVDLGKINDQIFVNVATVGLSTKIAAELTVQNKRRFGRFVYGIAVGKALFNLKPFKVIIKTEKGEETYRTLQLVIGCGRFHAGPFRLSPTSSITDGKLNLYVLADSSRWTLVKYALYLPGGRFSELKEVESTSITGGHIETIPVRKVTVDGEIETQTPFDFSVLPGAIQVMVPDDWDG